MHTSGVCCIIKITEGYQKSYAANVKENGFKKCLISQWVSNAFVSKVEVLQNSIRRHTRKDFDYRKLQICKSNIDISISFLFIYLNLIVTI